MAQGIKANISPEVLSQLLEEHTSVEIAEILNVSVGTITRYKKKYGLKSNPKIVQQRNSQKHTKYSCDINYFDNIDNLDKAYLLGFICADGFVTPQNCLGICVAEKDKAIVEFFKDQLKSEKPIFKKVDSSGYKSVELRVQNKDLVDRIKQYGVVPNKSLILDIEKIIKKANLNEKQISTFLLGYFDGDGCISLAHRKKDHKKYFEMNVTGTLETITYFYNYFGNGVFTQRHPNTNNYTLQFSNNYATIYNALSKIYKHKNELTFCLQRKYELFVLLQTKIKS